MAWQTPPPHPIIVTIIPEPSHQTTFADVLLGSIGLTAVLVVVAAVLGALLAAILIRWNRRHPADDNHLPPISPLVPDPGARRSSPAR